MTDRQVTMEGLIDYMEDLIKDRFSQQVNEIYFGDIGVYLPASFGGSRQTQKAVIALSPSFNRRKDRSAVHEVREMGVDIIVMVNLTPYFTARPQEALGERQLVRLVEQIATFLTQDEHITLGGRVEWSEVGDIDWAWMARGDQAIRAAAISYQVRVRLSRL